MRKLEKIKPFGHSKAPKKKKIMTDFADFPRPGENYLYILSIYFIRIYLIIFLWSANVKPSGRPGWENDLQKQKRGYTFVFLPWCHWPAAEDSKHCASTLPYLHSFLLKVFRCHKVEIVNNNVIDVTILCHFIMR